MIKKLIDKLLGKTSTPRNPRARFGKRREVPVAEHNIDPALVDERARNVVLTLKQAGYEAYIVGGAVRDLLVGLKPKDFDVATSATPEQVKGLFRRAFIIGRRFRIVHVVYGRGREHEVIEVSTFRAYMDNTAAEQVAGNERTSKNELAGMQHAVDASGRVLRDNVWGPQDEDATRRDFTINAMYYDPETQVVVDYHGGIEDAKKLKLRMIGDPATRYREDPVRIIRAVRFSAKLQARGFHLDPKTAAPLAASKGLLADVPQSRLFDEMLKLLQTGHALATIAQLRALGLAQGLYPLLDLIVTRAEQPFVRAALQDTDRRVNEGKSVAPSFLLSCVLWSDVREGWERRQQQGNQPPFQALLDAIDEVFHARIGDVSGGGKLAGDMREIWTMQPRFDKRTGNAPFSLVEQPRFRAGFDFMRLRADIGEVDAVLADWWQSFTQANDHLRRDMVEQVRSEQQKGRTGGSSKFARAPRPEGAPAPRRPRTAASSAPARAAGEAAAPLDADAAESAHAEGEELPEVLGDGQEAPRKRRRRRRRPTGEGTSAAGGSAPPAGE